MKLDVGPVLHVFVICLFFAPLSGCVDWFLLGNFEMPEELKEAKILLGSEIIERRDFSVVPRIGVISDIASSDRVDRELLIVGSEGASYISFTGESKETVPFADFVPIRTG